MQFDVYEISPGRLVMVVQADAATLPSCVVAPLIPMESGPARISILEPSIEIGGVEYSLHVGELAAIPASLIRGVPLARCPDREWEIRKALDFFLSGI
ncbi:CcdB family protein [Jannaschia formosa]|uniref:CcdB family protein n=1 Tax=Jannaschia formosa TaxID=2259592 RepID=UPI000E1B7997|nr:CcdB family protein [Jannaschia formosa]TFL19778.1 plasmid maintenance protein CcdB [Jannaschia formosa]